MRFLRQLLSRYANWLQGKRLRTLDSSGATERLAPYTLGQDERVARFIYSLRKMRTTGLRPKPSAFDPSPYMELSTVHSSGLADDEIWEIGTQTLRSEPGRTAIYGRADVPVRSLADVKLRALRDDEPFKRHTSIVDWPLGSDPNETKALWKQICLELSEDARISLVIPPTTVVQT